jgi:hypothetical protein
MFGDSSVSRAGVLDGVQYSVLPGSDVTGSPANESDDVTVNSSKSSRTQPPIHTEVTQHHVGTMKWLTVGRMTGVRFPALLLCRGPWSLPSELPDCSGGYFLHRCKTAGT